MLPRSGMLLSPMCWSDPCRVRSADRFLLGTAAGPLWVSLAACCQPAAPWGSPRGHTRLMVLFDPSKLAFGGRAQSEPSAGCVRAPFPGAGASPPALQQMRLCSSPALAVSISLPLQLPLNFLALWPLCC